MFDSLSLRHRASLLLALLALLGVFALTAAACGGGSGDDDDERSSQSDRNKDDDEDEDEDPTPTRASRTKDSDGDGIVDRDDECPDDEDLGQWSGEVDGCPDTIDDLLLFSYDDINAYWQNIFDENGVAYEMPVDFVTYGDDGGDSACGELSPENAFYCPLDHSIYMHLPFMESLLENRGDFAVAFVVAHEWGHLVQGNLGILDDPDLYSIEIELQADCFAGVWTLDAADRILEEGDKDEAILTLFQVGDPDGTEFFDPQAHGTPGQRIDAFNLGQNRGLDACFEDLTLPSNVGGGTLNN
ncbi:MAG: neutral zinc metallopeptidase [Dehalococcoidia bacterium]|nr:neutral zinc metallopeptidase [Dehalococcoidia bacterium]